MMKTIRAAAVVFVAFSIFLAWIAAKEAQTADAKPGKYTLRYKFQPGQTLRWQVVHRKRLKTTVAGETQTVETVSKSVKAWRVKEVWPDGTATFENLVESADMWQKLGGCQEIRYNSQTDKQPPPVFEDLAASMGVPLSTVTINSRGQVLSRRRNPSLKSAENEGDITIPLSKEPVAVGDSWSFPSQIEVPLNGGRIKKVKAVQKFTLASVNTGVATIKVATRILTPIHDPAIEALLIHRESTGTVRFDIDAGAVLGQQMDVDKRVVGFRGEVSSLHYLARFSEDLLPEEIQTASRPTPAESKTQ